MRVVVPLGCSRASALGAVLLGCTLGAATANGTVWYVPGVANAGGRNNTHFSSDVRILNRGSAPVLASFELVPTGGDPPSTVSRAIAPGETFVSLNVLATLWGFSGSGTLKVTVDQPVCVLARTYNDADPSGTYGTALTPLTHEDLLEAGDTGHAAWVSESPDSSKDYRTNLAVFLALPDSSVDVVLFDAAGREKGRTNVSGGPLMFQTSVSALVAAGLPVGRAEFRVLSGKAAAYVPVVDNVTGDGISIPAERPPLQETRAVLNGAARASGREGTFFRTDVRLFNLSDLSATVAVTPLSVAGVTTPASVTLAPGELREITDVLGTLLGAPEGSTGSILFASSEPVVVLGRTSNVKRDGTPGTYGALQKGRREASFLGTGSDAVLIGLRQSSDRPGYRTNVGILAGSDGAKLHLTLRSRTWDLLGTNDALSLGAWEWTQPSLGDLFAGVAIPADAVLEIAPRSGRADLYASVIDNATGDPVINAAEDFARYACPLPEILTFEASPDTLASAGNVTLTWATGGADSLSGVAGATAANGSVTVPVSASGAFQLRAANSCGTVSATANVVVGPPTVQLVSAASGSPGELVTLALGNVAVPESTGSVLLTFSDGIAFRTAARGSAGSSRVRFIVPFLPDALAPSGYRQGGCTITVDAFGPASAPVPFTITPLVPSGDPVAGFNAYLDSTFGPIDAALADAGGTADLQPGFSSISGSVHAYEAILRKVAADLAGAESTVTPADVPTDDVPSPESVTVTRSDLGLLLALTRNLQSSSAQLAASGVAASGLGAGQCLSVKYPILGLCLTLKNLDPENVARELYDGLVHPLGIKDDGTVVTGIANGLSWLTSTYLKVVEIARGACPAMPVWLRNFVGSPDRVSVDETQDVKVRAYMDTLVTSDSLAAYVTNVLTKFVLGKFCSALPKDVKEKWVEKATEFLQTQNAPIRQALAGWAKAHGGVASPYYMDQVGACDLDMGATHVIPPELAELDLNYPQGEDDFYVRGHRTGNAVFLVYPRKGHFLYPVSLDQALANPAAGSSASRYTLPMRVGGAAGFSVTGIQLQLVDANGVLQTAGYSLPRSVVTRRWPFRFKASGAFAGNTISASTSDDLTFSVTVNGLAGPPQATYTTFAYSFLYETPRGSLGVSGSVAEGYVSVRRSVDGAGSAALIDNAWSQGLKASDSFTSRSSSYQVSNSQRLIDGAAGVGSSIVLYVFRNVPQKGSSGGGSSWNGSGPTGGVMTSLSGGRSSGSLRAESAGAHASTATLLAATNGGGVYTSTDGGGTWAAVTSGPADPAVMNLARDPRNDATVWAGTKTGGVYRSADGGGTWTSLGLSGALTNAVVPDPLDSSVVYALQYRTTGGLLKSLDGGQNWSPRGTGLASAAIPNGLVIAPGSSSTLYLSTSKGLYKSTDSAGSFASIGAGATGSCASKIVGIPSTPFTLIAGGCASDLWRSRDGGATWSALPGCATGTGSLAVAADGTLLASSTRAICRSTDLGSSWTSLPTGTTDEVSGVGLAADASGALFALTTTGLLRSTNGGASFSAANAGIAASWISQVLVDRQGASVLYAISALSAGGTCGRPYRSADGGTTWTRIDSALAVVPDVCRMAQDPSTAAVYFVGDSNGTPKAARSRDGASTWQEVVLPLIPYSGESAFYDVFFGAAPASPLYVASNTKLYVSTTGGSAWSEAGTWPPVNWVVFPLAASPRDPNDVLCNVAMSGLYRTKDGGRSWAQLPGPSDLSSTNQVAFDLVDPARIYAATSHGVFRSTDGGGTFTQTTQTSSTAAVAPDPSSAGTLYAGRGYAVGGGGGVFRSKDGGDTWTQVGTGFSVQKLAVSADGKTVCAATSGFGVRCQSVDAFAATAAPEPDSTER